MEKFIIMSIKEKHQVRVYEQLVRKEITQKTAAEELNLSPRQVRNKVKRFKSEGIEGLVHKNRGKTSSKRFDADQRAFAVELLKSELWFDFGPTFAAEKLRELHNIQICRESVRTIMRQEGIPYNRRKGRKKRKCRERKRRFGIMIQLDGSPHKWFGPTGDEYTLLVFIDDATSKIVWLEFAKSESIESVMTAMRHYIEKFGRPVSLYVDFGSVFRVSLNNPDHEKLSQFERAAKELDIIIIHAHSPQAKGRVERSNQTHQNRLIKELRLVHITNFEEANAFLPAYIDQHNRSFASKPAIESGDAHRSIEGYNLDEIFCIHEIRKIRNDYTISFKNRTIQLTDQRNIKYKPSDELLVKAKFDGTLTLSIRGYSLEYEELLQRPKKHVPEKIYNNSKPRPVSEASRRWKSGSMQLKDHNNKYYPKEGAQ